MSKNIVISFAKGSPRYLDGVERIRKACLKQGIAHWIFNDESEITDECPSHYHTPYGFKAYAISLAYQRGYDKILWLDSVVDIVQPLDKIFEHIENNGTAFFNNLGYKVKDFCNDSCKRIMGATESELNSPMIMACVLGLNRNLAKAFINDYMIYCNLGAFKGSWSDHRHDQTVASILISRYTYPLLIGHETFFMYEEHINKTVYIEDIPITMTKGKDVCLISR